MFSTIPLRPYQKTGREQIYESWKSYKRVMFQMPTGTGKTTLFASIARTEYTEGNPVLIVVHRKELVEQIFDRLQDQFGITAGLIMSGHPEDRNKSIQVASIQTLTRRKHPEASLIIIDEAHHTKAETYRELWDIYPTARVLGVTATPVRLDGQGFDDLFDVLLQSNPIKDFIRQGHLSDLKYFATTHQSDLPDLSRVTINQGDYDVGELSQVMRDDHLMANLVKSYLDHAQGKKTIVFAVDVSHSQSIVERYKLEGIEAEHIDAQTDKRTRKEIIERFRRGETLVLSNVDIVSEGFDVPDCDAVQLARPTKSLAKYLQQVGRCMRTATGKKCGIILDNAGLYFTHGSPKADRIWSLKGTEISPQSLIENNGRITGDGSTSLPEESDELTLTLLEDIDPMTTLSIGELQEMINGLKSKIKDMQAEQVDQIPTTHSFRLLDKEIQETELQIQKLQEQIPQALQREQGSRLERKLIQFQSFLDRFFASETWETPDDISNFISRIEFIKNSNNLTAGFVAAKPVASTAPVTHYAQGTSTKSQPEDFEFPYPMDYVNKYRSNDEELNKITHSIGHDSEWSDLCKLLDIDHRGDSARRAFSNWAERRGLPSASRKKN